MSVYELHKLSGHAAYELIDIYCYVLRNEINTTTTYHMKINPDWAIQLQAIYNTKQAENMNMNRLVQTIISARLCGDSYSAKTKNMLFINVELFNSVCNVLHLKKRILMHEWIWQWKRKCAHTMLWCWDCTDCSRIMFLVYSVREKLYVPQTMHRRRKRK